MKHDPIDRRALIRAALASAGAAAVPWPAFAQSGARAPDAPRTGAASVAAHRVEVPMPHGGVAAGHPLAASAGLRMLLQGGSDADAAVAAMAVLNVVEPWASSAAGNDRGMSIQAAIKAPRFALDADPSFYTPGAAITVQMENRFPAPFYAELTRMGHRVAPVGPFAIGSVQGVLVDASGARMGGADPRRMGYAAGW